VLTEHEKAYAKYRSYYYILYYKRLNVYLYVCGDIK